MLVTQVPSVVSSILVVGVLACCALLHYIAQMNMKCSWIQEFMSSEIELGYNAFEVNKNFTKNWGRS